MPPLEVRPPLVCCWYCVSPCATVLPVAVRIAGSPSAPSACIVHAVAATEPPAVALSTRVDSAIEPSLTCAAVR